MGPQVAANAFPVTVYPLGGQQPKQRMHHRHQTGGQQDEPNREQQDAVGVGGAILIVHMREAHVCHHCCRERQARG